MLSHCFELVKSEPAGSELKLKDAGETPPYMQSPHAVVRTVGGTMDCMKK
jgi:hypothetical protein